MVVDLLARTNSSVFYFFLAALGACFGSFAALIIYRWPRDISIISPGSFCGVCEKKIRPWHNIPIISGIILRGKCAYCRANFGHRSLVIEAILMLALIAIYAKYGLSLALVERFAFTFLLICLSYIDLDTYSLPLSLLIALAALGLLFSGVYYFYPDSYRALGDPHGFLRVLVLNSPHGYALSDRLWGGMLGFVSFMLINAGATYVLRRTGSLGPKQWAMGFGDPILLMGIGLFVGAGRLVLVIFLASAAGSLVGIIQRLHKSKPVLEEDIAPGALPYGPFLALAALYAYLV